MSLKITPSVSVIIAQFVICIRPNPFITLILYPAVSVFLTFCNRDEAQNLIRPTLLLFKTAN